MSQVEIERIISDRNITEVLHFTSNHGVVGALVMGDLLSRRRLPKEDHLAYLAAPTSATRQEASDIFDKAADWLDFINLSISEINVSYFNFASKKWHVTGDRWWAILAFRPEILAHPGVFFATTNNVYEHVKRTADAAGLNSLFDTTIRRKGAWRASRGTRAANLTTCQQAEVLYPGTLSTQYLFRIYVRTVDEHDIVAGWLRYFAKPNIEIVISPEKFSGMPN